VDLGEGVTASAFFYYFLAAAGKKVRGIFNYSTNKPHYWSTTRGGPYPALLIKLD
jgi:hypothetical protein